MLNRVVFIFLFAGVWLCFTGVTPAAIYKWVNENGVVSYQDSPPPTGTKVKILPESPALPATPAPQTQVASPALPVPSVITRSAPRSAPKVEIYMTSWCRYCKKAKSFFNARGISYTAYDIEKDRAAAARMARLNPGGGVPLTVIDGQVIRGFSESAYSAALQNRP